jgi:hypothetical protein
VALGADADPLGSFRDYGVTACSAVVMNLGFAVGCRCGGNAFTEVAMASKAMRLAVVRVSRFGTCVLPRKSLGTAHSAASRRTKPGWKGRCAIGSDALTFWS